MSKDKCIIIYGPQMKLNHFVMRRFKKRDLAVDDLTVIDEQTIQKNRNTKRHPVIKKVLPFVVLSAIGLTVLSQKLNHPVKVTQTDIQQEIINEDTTTWQKPAVAIFYARNGDVYLQINNETLTLEEATTKYPELTADINEYITATHQPTKTDDTMSK